MASVSLLSEDRQPYCLPILWPDDLDQFRQARAPEPNPDLLRPSFYGAFVLGTDVSHAFAIGARRLDVLFQFLEAVFLSVSGGIAGVPMSIIFSAGISFVFGWRAPISPAAVAGGFLFAAAVGVFFGYLPGPESRSSRSDRGAALRMGPDATALTWIKVLAADRA